MLASLYFHHVLGVIIPVYLVMVLVEVVKHTLCMEQRKVKDSLPGSVRIYSKRHLATMTTHHSELK